MTPHTARTSTRWTIVVFATAALIEAWPAPAAAQQTRALVAPYIQIPAGIRFAEIIPQVYGPRAAEVAQLEAFTLPDVDRRTVFVNVERPLWKAAAGADPGACLYRAMLASIIAHELMHLRGARSEVTALREERRVWIRFLRDRLVPVGLGLERARLLDAEIEAALRDSAGTPPARGREAHARE